MHCRNKVYHLNFSSAGHIKLASVCDHQWSPAYTILQVLLSICELLRNPNVGAHRRHRHCLSAWRLLGLVCGTAERLRHRRCRAAALLCFLPPTLRVVLEQGVLNALAGTGALDGGSVQRTALAGCGQCCQQSNSSSVWCAEMPVQTSIAHQLLTDRAKHDETAADWTRRFAQG